MRNAIIFSLAVLLASCATSPKMLWVRTDGKPASADPVLAQQFEVDTTVCLGERQKADLSGVTVTSGGLAGIAASMQRSQSADAVQKGCMAQRGYILVPEEEAASRSAQLAAVAAEKDRRDRALAQSSRR